jgi:septum site-determining protein MinD
MHQWPVTLNEVLAGKAKLSDALARDATSGVMVLPASLKAEGIDPKILNRLQPLAAKLAESFDFVLLDGSPGIGIEARATLEAARELLYVSSPTTPSVMDVVRLRHLVSGMGKKELGVALNLCHPNASQLSPQDVNRMVELEVIAQVPFDILVERSLSEQSSVVAAYPKSPATEEFIALAAKLSGAYKPRGKNGGIASQIDRRLSGLRDFAGL